MNEKKYDLIYFIGRISPPHIAHEATIKRAKELAHNVCVLKGSANLPRTPKNPFLFQEIEHMIHISCGKDVLVLPVNDCNSDPEWIHEMSIQMDNAIEHFDVDENKVAIIGMKKDASSYYLDYFKHIPFIEMDRILAGERHDETIDATKIRQLLYTGQHQFVKSVLPQPVYNFIVNEFMVNGYADAIAYDSDLKAVYDIVEKYSGEPWIDYGFEQLRDEYHYNAEYPKKYGVGPHVTVDSIVVQSGHVLMIRRRNVSGRGLWAFPGGFLEVYETIADAWPRELREETLLKVALKVLKGSVVHTEVFDEVNRSERARIITHAHLIKLDDTQDLPRVAGADDADKAKWVSIADFYKMAPVMFEDHYKMGCTMLAHL